MEGTEEGQRRETGEGQWRGQKRDRGGGQERVTKGRGEGQSGEERDSPIEERDSPQIEERDTVAFACICTV